MLGLSSTSSYAVFVYLCICIYVFVYETLGNISLDIHRPELSVQNKATTCFLSSSEKRTRNGVPSLPICSNILRLSSAKYENVICDVVCLPACLLFKHLLNDFPLKLALLYFCQASVPCSATTSASAATLAQVSLRQSFKINLFLV